MIKDNPNRAECARVQGAPMDSCAKQEVERDSLARLANLVAQLDERLNDANTEIHLLQDRLDRLEEIVG